MTKDNPFSAKGNFMLQQLLHDSVAVSVTERQWRHDGCRSVTKHPESGPHAISNGLLESIAARRARGESFASIATALNKQGISGGYGSRWYASSVWAYLHRHMQTKRIAATSVALTRD